jgi:glycosyltransferase involved in cell wall biosynthesis
MISERGPALVRFGSTLQPLEHLVFNFLPVRPEISGGVATICQAMARHIPPAAGAGKTWVLTGHDGWDANYPLQGEFERLDYSAVGKRKLAFDLERRLSAGDWTRRLRHAVARLRGLRSAFPAALAQRSLVHCPYQILHPTPPRHWALPYVINLHDLQHEHFPEFFSAEELQRRRTDYLASARAAAAACVVDEWTRRDVLAHLDIPESRVFVAPFGPTWSAAPPPDETEIQSLRQRHNLPQSFAYYPAQTWPHKNHLRLLEALHLLKAGGLQIHVVCTGHRNDHFQAIQAKVVELGLEDQVRFLGVIPQPDVHGLYRAARMTVVPSLFEGGPGIPVLEAMALGSPLAASTACGIPDAVGDAALLFDGLNVAEMAQAMKRLWLDPNLRQDLAARGLARSATCTWERAARTYVEVYAEARQRWLRERPPH